MTVAPPDAPDHPYLAISSATSEPERPNPVKQRALTIPGVTQDYSGEERRRSYDDGVRPLNVLFGRDNSIHKPNDGPVVSNGLAAPPSRRDKRRSINPGVSLPELNVRTSTQPSISALSSPSNSLPVTLQIDRVQTSPLANGRESPHSTLSPLREQLSPKLPSPHPTSHSSLQRSNSSGHSPSSGLYHGDGQDLSHPSSPTRSNDQTIIVTAPSTNVTVGSVPSSKARTKACTQVITTADGSQCGDVRQLSGPKESETLRFQRSADNIQHAESRPTSTSSLVVQLQPRSRSVSPARCVDVPQSVEYETNADSEAENPEERAHSQDSVPPTSPQDADQSSPSKGSTVGEEIDVVMPLLESGSEDLSESSPVEYTSHSTFIAPALPPIRLSLSSNDFSELFNSVGGFPSRISLSQLAKISEGQKSGKSTPPSAAADSDVVTPTPRAPALPSTVEESEADDDTIKVTEKRALPQDDIPSQLGNGYTSSEARDDDPPPLIRLTQAKDVLRRPSLSSTSDSSHASRPQHLTPKSGNIADVSNVSFTFPNRSANTQTCITLTEPDSKTLITLSEGADVVIVRLQEAVADARDRGAQHLKLERASVEAILTTLETQKTEYLQLTNKFDGVKVCVLYTMTEISLIVALTEDK